MAKLSERDKALLKITESVETCCAKYATALGKLPKQRRKVLKQHLMNVPLEHHEEVLKSNLGLQKDKAAIYLFCMECMGWEEPLEENVHNCTAVTCPLFHKRPFLKLKRKAKAD